MEYLQLGKPRLLLNQQIMERLQSILMTASLKSEARIFWKLTSQRQTIQGWIRQLRLLVIEPVNGGT